MAAISPGADVPPNPKGTGEQEDTAVDTETEHRNVVDDTEQPDDLHTPMSGIIVVILIVLSVEPA